jgi:hypothetical protein
MASLYSPPGGGADRRAETMSRPKKSKSRLRRNLREMRELRDAQLRDLGGLVVDLYRFGQQRDALVRDKLEALIATDREMRELARRLDPEHRLESPRQGIETCPGCGSLFSANSRYCRQCGVDLRSGLAAHPLERPLGEPAPHPAPELDSAEAASAAPPPPAPVDAPLPAAPEPASTPPILPVPPLDDLRRVKAHFQTILAEAARQQQAPPQPQAGPEPPARPQDAQPPSQAPPQSTRAGPAPAAGQGPPRARPAPAARPGGKPRRRPGKPVGPPQRQAGGPGARPLANGRDRPPTSPTGESQGDEAEPSPYAPSDWVPDGLVPPEEETAPTGAPAETDGER